MADNANLTTPAGLAAADEVPYSGDTALVQLVRLVNVAGAEGSKVVNPFRDLKLISVASAGLTTGYTVGDQLGNLFTLPDAATVSGGGGTIVGITLIDAAAQISPVDVVIFESSVTLAADNAAFSISDADALKIVSILQPAGPYFMNGFNVAQLQGLAVPYTCVGGTSLYAALILRGAIGGGFSATDIQMKLYVERN